MNLPQLKNPVPKVLPVAAISSTIPGLALLGTLLGTDKGKGNDGQDKGNHTGKTNDGDPVVSSVPEANPAIVLIPFVGAVLLFSSLQLLRLRAQKSGSLS